MHPSLKPSEEPDCESLEPESLVEDDSGATCTAIDVVWVRTESDPPPDAEAKDFLCTTSGPSDSRPDVPYTKSGAGPPVTCMGNRVRHDPDGFRVWGVEQPRAALERWGSGRRHLILSSGKFVLAIT